MLVEVSLMVPTQTMQSNQHSIGGEDAWVAQLDAHGGAARWMRQFGTFDDDTLSRNQPLDVDSDGNVIAFGETKGPFFFHRTVIQDVFLMTTSTIEASAGNKFPVGTLPIKHSAEPENPFGGDGIKRGFCC